MAQNRLAALQSLQHLHTGQKYDVVLRDLGITWEMVTVAGSIQSFLSTTQLRSLLQGGSNHQELPSLKKQIHKAFKAVYSESNLLSLITKSRKARQSRQAAKDSMR